MTEKPTPPFSSSSLQTSGFAATIANSRSKWPFLKFSSSVFPYARRESRVEMSRGSELLVIHSTELCPGVDLSKMIRAEVIHIA